VHMDDPDPTNGLETLRTAELFKMYRGILRELTQRGIVRTMNAPAGDYAEYLVAALVGGELADNSEKSWDIRTADGERLQVKCRVVQEGKRGQRQLSPFRTWDFDRAVIVLCASVSHDRGETWMTHRISTPTTNSELGWALPSGGAIDSSGNAYFAWAGYEQNGKPSGEVNLFVSRSRNGGETWKTDVVDVSEAPPPCECGGWAYWGAQMALGVDDQDIVYLLYNANRKKFGVNRMFFARSTDRGRTWTGRAEISDAPKGANNLFPAVASRGNGDVRIAWQDDRNGFDAGGEDPTARWNTYYRTTENGGRTWSGETQLSRFVDGYDYKIARRKNGYLEPYGDYFELDIDGIGRTHAPLGRGPKLSLGPGNVWYSRVASG
jgi:hypothetical protein